MTPISDRSSEQSFLITVSSIACAVRFTRSQSFSHLPSYDLDQIPMLLMIPVAIATSYGFIMPVGTPPNAIVFGSGYVTARRMARAGLPLDLIGIGIVSVLVTLLAPLVWG